MRKRCLSVILLSLLILQPFLLQSNGSSAEIRDNILLYEINPFGDNEGISIFNYGSEQVNLKEWSMTDGEGTITFIKDLYIGPRSRLTIVKTITDDWFSNRSNVISQTDDIIQKKGSFILSNTGDDIYIFKKDILMDTVCYGNKSSDNGWIGTPVSLPSNKYLLRIDHDDTDSSSDWISTKPGITNNIFDPNLYFDSVVTPFSFPESQGIPIFKEIERAEHEIFISMYLLTSVDLVALLCKLSLENGINVCILLEGDVLGTDIDKELMLMKSAADAGINVCLINDNISGNFERYSYLHSKYAIVDSKKVIITSENWTSSNLGPSCSNRGWGAVIESEELASYMRTVFLNDLDPEYGDVRSLKERYPKIGPYPGVLDYTPISEGQHEYASFNASVMPVLSPDNSLSALKHLIDNSHSRVYSEQLDLGSSFDITSEYSPLCWMASAAERGVDARLILDSSIDKNSKYTIVESINYSTDIKAITVNGKDAFTMIHNKGVIIDDIVWVGSINWTENSFKNNREFAVVIESEDITNIFVDLFIDDWGTNEHTIAETGLDISHEILQTKGDVVHFFIVSGPEDQKYVWDVLGDGKTRKSDINRIVCKNLPAGNHTMKVLMEGTEHSAIYSYTVAHEGTSGLNSEIIYIVVAIGSMSAGSLGIIIKRRNNNR